MVLHLILEMALDPTGSTNQSLEAVFNLTTSRNTFLEIAPYKAASKINTGKTTITHIELLKR